MFKKTIIKKISFCLIFAFLVMNSENFYNTQIFYERNDVKKINNKNDQLALMSGLQTGELKHEVLEMVYENLNKIYKEQGLRGGALDEEIQKFYKYLGKVLEIKIDTNEYFIDTNTDQRVRTIKIEYNGKQYEHRIVIDKEGSKARVFRGEFYPKNGLILNGIYFLPELLKIVFRNLPAISLGICARVCKTWFYLSRANRLWEYRCIKWCKKQDRDEKYLDMLVKKCNNNWMLLYKALKTGDQYILITEKKYIELMKKISFLSGIDPNNLEKVVNAVTIENINSDVFDIFVYVFVKVFHNEDEGANNPIWRYFYPTCVDTKDMKLQERFIIVLEGLLQIDISNSFKRLIISVLEEFGHRAKSQEVCLLAIEKVKGLINLSNTNRLLPIQYSLINSLLTIYDRGRSLEMCTSIYDDSNWLDNNHKKQKLVLDILLEIFLVDDLNNIFQLSNKDLKTSIINALQYICSFSNDIKTKQQAITKLKELSKLADTDEVRTIIKNAFGYIGKYIENIELRQQAVTELIYIYTSADTNDLKKQIIRVLRDVLFIAKIPIRVSDIFEKLEVLFVSLGTNDDLRKDIIDALGYIVEDTRISEIRKLAIIELEKLFKIAKTDELKERVIGGLYSSNTYLFNTESMIQSITKLEELFTIAQTNTVRAAIINVYLYIIGINEYHQEWLQLGINALVKILLSDSFLDNISSQANKKLNKLNNSILQALVYIIEYEKDKKTQELAVKTIMKLYNKTKSYRLKESIKIVLEGLSAHFDKDLINAEILAQINDALKQIEQMQPEGLLRAEEALRKIKKIEGNAQDIRIQLDNIWANVEIIAISERECDFILEKEMLHVINYNNFMNVGIAIRDIAVNEDIIQEEKCENGIYPAYSLFHYYESELKKIKVRRLALERKSGMIEKIRIMSDGMIVYFIDGDNIRRFTKILTKPVGYPMPINDFRRINYFISNTLREMFSGKVNVNFFLKIQDLIFKTLPKQNYMELLNGQGIRNIVVAS
jgi:hypothetical protein